ncbi:MAG TPA: hypothetical protein VJ808_14205 [Gemmatimonadales bacterium]|nr:hypothetical protein [Gemmatimonadales bacterium]
MPPTSADSWRIPELGPSLGRLVDPPLTHGDRGALDLVLDDIRLELVTGIFELAGAARSFAASGDRQGAISSFSRVAWLGLWERAVAASAERLAQVVNARLTEAAAEARLPAKQLETFLLKTEDVRAIAARLGSGGASFVGALDALEQTVPGAAAPGDRGRAGQEDWERALAAAARRLEAGWLALVAGARLEQDHWKVEIEKARAWRRPTTVLWLLSAALFVVATYLGLILGGYITVPAPLSSFAEFWWAHL